MAVLKPIQNLNQVRYAAPTKRASKPSSKGSSSISLEALHLIAPPQSISDGFAKPCLRAHLSPNHYLGKSDKPKSYGYERTEPGYIKFNQSNKNKNGHAPVGVREMFKLPPQECLELMDNIASVGKRYCKRSGFKLILDSTKKSIGIKFYAKDRIFSKIQGKGNRAPVVNAGQVYTLKGAFPFVSPQFFN